MVHSSSVDRCEYRMRLIRGCGVAAILGLAVAEVHPATVLLLQNGAVVEFRLPEGVPGHTMSFC